MAEEGSGQRQRGSATGMAALAVSCLALASTLAFGDAALAGNEYGISRVAVAPAGKGSAARPLPVKVRFGLKVGEEDRRLRPAPVETYVIGAEGMVAFPQAFPACSLRKLRRRRGVPRACAEAKVGGGLVKAAAGLREDVSMESSVPCNLRLGVYNSGRGVALRLDSGPPLPPGFKSDRVGCPVPVHTAIGGRLVETRIDGVRSTDLRFSLPRLLLEPLDGWDGALRVVDVTIGPRTEGVRLRGRAREVAYYSSVGCRGGGRTVRAVFIDQLGGRAEVTRTAKC